VCSCLVGARCFRHQDSARVLKTKKRKRTMFKKDSKKSFALGAAFALFASMFAAVPAAQADANGIVIAPLSGTSSKMLVTEEFALKFALGQNVDDDKKDRVKFFVEKPAGYRLTVSNTVSATANLVSTATGMTNTSIGAATTISSVVTPGTVVTGVNQLVFQVYSDSALTSISPAVDIKLTMFIDLTNDGIFDSGTEPSTVYTVNFVKHSAMGATVTLTQPIEGDDEAVASAAVSGVNFNQLNSNFNLYVTSTNDGRAGHNAGSSSGNVAPTTAAAGGDGSLSISTAIAAAVANESISAVVAYGGTAGSNTLAFSKVGVTATTIDDITVSAVVGNNLAVSTAAKGDARVNSALAFDVWPYTGSKTTSVAVAMKMTVGAFAGLTTDKYLVIEGTKYTDSSKLPTVSAVTLAAGKNRIDVSSFGFSGSENDLVFTFTALNDTATYTLDWAKSTYTLENGDATANTKPGTAVSLMWDVEDQWGVASTNPNHRVVAYWVGDSNFSASATASFAVSGAKSTVTMTPSPATATGSATLRVSLQTQAVDSGLWTTNETENVTVVVSALAGGFTSSAVASKSASISYAAADGAYSWSPVYSGTAAVGGQDVAISGTGVVFKSATGKTASGAITVRAGSDGAFTFYAASTLAGTHTISMVAGGSTTTSLLVVSPALHDAGKSMTIDKTEILAGATSTITGTLVDANGNPVATGDTASILVKWTGKGLPFNLPTSTNADGEFEFQVLALSSEVGEAAVSVTYMPTGSTTYTKNITSAYAVDIVSSLTSVAEQKITVGTFKGYVAIYTKGYMGQKLSAKVAGRWLVVDPIAAYKSNDYSRVVRLTGAGYTITVDLYIDGVFVRSEVVTTK